jgi:hypothetical protein
MVDDRTVASEDLAVSFIVDQDPTYAYMGWHLAHSLADCVKLPWPRIHVQCTREVPRRTVEVFRKLGCSTHRLERFGDGRFCNKLAQWDNLRDVSEKHLVFLDTDMICIDDFTRFLPADAVGGKVVDLENPKLRVIEVLFDRARFEDRPEIVEVDMRQGKTFKANCNGGFYSVPKLFAEPLFEAWRRHALALLADLEPLKAASKESHVDQIAFCMAMHDTKLPFAEIPTNLNYPLHLAGPKRFARSGPLTLLHYHAFSLNVVGLIEVQRELDGREKAAVDQANEQIKAKFETETFWGFRYRRFPERGSGVGSRGANLQYKRNLLKAAGAEEASSVLDVGCGDLEVVHVLDLKNYVGIDPSQASLVHAAARRPLWTFHEAPAPDIASAEMVLCLEVTIHQPTAADYAALIAFLASKTDRTLIVSGYDAFSDKIAANHMLHFYEPLRLSLEKTGRFKRVDKIGAHSDLVIYRCETR